MQKGIKHTSDIVESESFFKYGSYDKMSPLARNIPCLSLLQSWFCDLHQLAITPSCV